MNLVASIVILFSIITPTKTWFAPQQPIEVKVEAKEALTLMAVDFSGKPLDAAGSAEIPADKTIDLKAVFPQVGQPGCYVVFAVPRGKPITQFLGSPLMIQARPSKRSGQTTAVRVSPLVYARIQTDKGDIKAIFWFDVAPNTANAFVSLSQGGFYDGLTFHRIVPGFVIQGGDPTASGFGGPGYTLGEEFSDKSHDVGVLSMARTGDPLEGKGVTPRPEFANSAGSQFFICLSREKTQALDRKYTTFGQVVQGMEAVNAIAATPLADPGSGKPKEPQVMKHVEIVPVSAQDNPYEDLLKLKAVSDAETTAPATAPTTPAK